MNKLEDGHLYNVPLVVVVEGSAVVLLGPDAVAIAMTPEAALTSSELLREAALKAQRADGPAAPVLPIDQS